MVLLEEGWGRDPGQEQHLVVAVAWGPRRLGEPGPPVCPSSSQLLDWMERKKLLCNRWVCSAEYFAEPSKRLGFSRVNFDLFLRNGELTG